MMKKAIFLIPIILLLAFAPKDKTPKDKTIQKLIESNNLAEIDALIKGGLDINSKFKKDNSMLHYACWNNNFEIVKYLIKQGADINVQNKSQWTPLLVSCIDYDTSDSITEYLINKGANLNIIAKNGHCITRCIMYSGYYSGEHERFNNLFKLIIEKGVELDTFCNDCCRQSPLINAANVGSNEILKMIIDENVDINALDCKGRNALMYAITSASYHGKIAVFLRSRMIINAGIDLKHMDDKGNTALDYAEQYGNQKLIDFIKTKLKES